MSYFFAPPRIFENLLTTVMIRMEDAGRIKRGMFHYFIGVAHRVGRKILEGKPVPVMDRLRYALGELLVYGPLKNVLRSEEHTSELQSLMRISYAVFCLKKK